MYLTYEKLSFPRTFFRFHFWSCSSVLTKAPITTSDVLDTTTEVSKTTTNSLLTTTQAANSTTDAPATTTKTPSTTAQVPDATTKVSDITTKLVYQPPQQKALASSSTYIHDTTTNARTTSTKIPITTRPSQPTQPATTTERVETTTQRTYDCSMGDGTYSSTYYCAEFYVCSYGVTHIFHCPPLVR